MNFRSDCDLCPRLYKFLKNVKIENPTYYCKPVPAFGDSNTKFLIVGLAPGLNGANRTGRPFTGDFAGIILYEALFYFGLSNKEQSIDLHDGLKLDGVKITNAVKCLPPENKPLSNEIKTCNQFLKEEILSIDNELIILSLGKISHDAVLDVFKLKKSFFKFKHGARHELSPNVVLYDSYHCSRYNTSTKRLTREMFFDVFRKIKNEMET